MWRQTRVWMTLVAVLASAGLAWAADDQLTGGANGNQTPQGPGPIQDSSPASSQIVGYKPIPNSMLSAGPERDASAVNPASTAPTANQSNLAGLPVTMTGPYTLGRNDVVQITVQGQPDFSGTFVINYDGTIQYGLVGDVKADGLTKEELTEKLTEVLKKYVRVPSVMVSIAAFNSKAIYILGEVARPGKYALRGDSIPIRDALIAAGLFTNSAALARVHIIKADVKNPTDRVLNLNKVFYKGEMKNDIDVINGDIVVVPATVWSRITGGLASILNPVSRARTVAYLATL